MIRGKWRTLVFATAMFNLSFTIWFSFAPFTASIAADFGLSVADLGIVASTAVVAVPLGRILIGPLTDRYGASLTGAITLVVIGLFSILSAYAQSYELFIGARMIASLAGITFVIGIQHVAEWFEERISASRRGFTPGSATPVPVSGPTSRYLACSAPTGAARCFRRTGAQRSVTSVYLQSSSARSITASPTPPEAPPSDRQRRVVSASAAGSGLQPGTAPSSSPQCT